MDQDIIKNAIIAAIPDATVEILDPLKDGVHLQCIVTAKSLADKSRVNRQKLVNNAIKQYFNDGSLHALGIKIKTA